MQTTNKDAAAISACRQTYELESVARTFKALGDPNRLRLVFRLLGAERGQNVGQAAGCCPVDLSVVSRHLSVLREAGVITREKRGKEAVYRIDSENLPAVLRSLADALESCCQSPLEKCSETSP